MLFSYCSILGLHGSNPREDALVDAIASQILDLWEAVLSQKRKKLKDSKLLDVLKQLNSFVKASKNNKYLIGEKVSFLLFSFLCHSLIFS